MLPEELSIKAGTGWLYDQGNWYYLYPEGSMAKGWIQVNGEWYYLNSSGEMQTGWIKDNGYSYYLNDNGAMAHDVTIDGYYLNDSGEWKPNESDNSQVTSDAEDSEDTDSETEIPDVTEKLNDLMRSYEERYYNVREVPMAGRLEIFYDLVKNKAELDLKNQPDWKSKQFIYNGEIIDNDVPGNIMYGYMGKVFGFSDTVLYAAAGYAQKRAGTSKEEWNNSTNFGDDPRDTERIKQGIEIYNETHKGWGWISPTWV